MPDIKEKQPIKIIAKERKTTAPKAPIRRGVKPVVAKTKQQIIEASWGTETEEQETQQNNLEIPDLPRLRGTKTVNESKAEPKTRENYIENLKHQQNQQRNVPKAVHNERHTESVDIKPKMRVETEPVTIPQQGSQAFVESQGRDAARKKLAQKQTVRNKEASTDSESASVLHPKRAETEIKSSEKSTSETKSVGETIKRRQKTGNAPKEKEAVKPIKAPTAKPTQASIAVQKATEQGKKSATKTMKKSAKQAAKSAAKAIVASVKSLTAILGTGGVVVVAVILLLLLVGGLLASPFGIFFSSDADNDLTIQQVMGQCNAQLSQQITDIENSVPHDELEQTGQTALWKDVLAVYAVKVTTDPEHPLDVVTMDEERAELLREIFFAMNTVDYFTEIYTEEITMEVTDEEGNVTEETETVERTRLMITISGKTAQQMANEYEFDEEQLEFLTELLSEDYANLWYGLPGGGGDDIVAVALSQVGNVGGQPYWSWYGFSSRVAWCACFVSWCGEQCGYIESGAMPRFSYCPTGVQWFKDHVQWADRSTVPEPGYIVFFDWDYDGVSDHVGIVESCDENYVYTVEGNANDAVNQMSYAVENDRIMGYGVPSYS